MEKSEKLISVNYIEADCLVNKGTNDSDSVLLLSD